MNLNCILNVPENFCHMYFMRGSFLYGAGFLSLEKSTNSNLQVKQYLKITAWFTFPPL
jgi:cytochrome bd-type quinol oxidase subunit 2